MLFFTAGCAGTQEESKVSDASANTARPEETKPHQEEEKNLKRAPEPQWIPNGIRSVSLMEDGEEVLHISREPAEYKMSFDYWEVLYPYDEYATVNTEVMFEMFQMLSALEFTPVQVGEGTDTGLADASSGFTVEYVDTLDDEQAKQTDEADTVAEVLLGKEDGNGGRYAAVAGNEEAVFLLPKAVIEMLYGREPFDYLLKIPVLVSADTVSSVELIVGKKRYEIQVDTAKDSYSFGKKKTDKETFAALYQEISGMMLVSELEGKGNGGKDGTEPELTVVYHRNRADAPEVWVSYYPYDEEYDSVEVNGVERFLVKKEDVEGVVGKIKKALD